MEQANTPQLNITANPQFLPGGNIPEASHEPPAKDENCFPHLTHPVKHKNLTLKLYRILMEDDRIKRSTEQKNGRYY